jgi:23S rRNA (guanosine2251-2'-O)-methyltransferase
MSELDRMADGARHQGVIAETRPYRYAEPEDMLAAAEAAGEPPLIVVLDGVTDPHNLGAIARSAYLMGAHGLIVPRDRSAEVNPTSTKVSAGAVEHLAIAQVTNLFRTLGELKDHGLWIHGVAAEEGAQELAATDLRGPVCLVLGSEGAGLRPLVARQCDLFTVIPMVGSQVGSFNVSVAAAIALYECRRQRSGR